MSLIFSILINYLLGAVLAGLFGGIVLKLWGTIHTEGSKSAIGWLTLLSWVGVAIAAVGFLSYIITNAFGIKK